MDPPPAHTVIRKWAVRYSTVPSARTRLWSYRENRPEVEAAPSLTSRQHKKMAMFTMSATLSPSERLPREAVWLVSRQHAPPRLSKQRHQQYSSVCCLERHHRHARSSTTSSSYTSPDVSPRSSWVHRQSPGQIQRALCDATARPASYPNRTSPSRGGEVLTQQSDGRGDHVDRLHKEPLGKLR